MKAVAATFSTDISPVAASYQPSSCGPALCWKSLVAAELMTTYTARRWRCRGWGRGRCPAAAACPPQPPPARSPPSTRSGPRCGGARPSVCTAHGEHEYELRVMTRAANEDSQRFHNHGSFLTGSFKNLCQANRPSLLIFAPESIHWVNACLLKHKVLIKLELN